MAKFRYAALDSRGKEVQGTIESDDQTKAVAMIRQKGLFPTTVEPDTGRAPRAGGRSGGGARKSGGSGLKMEIKLPAFMASKVKPKQLMIFTRQLATLVDAGLPLMRGLRVLQKQEKHPTLKKALTEMAESIDGERARQALERAQAELKRKEADALTMANAEAALQRALVRLKVAELRKGRRR